MSSDPLRPGSTLGPYPERESTPPSRLDEFTQRLTGPLVRRRSAAELDAKGFLALVNAEGPRLSKLESVQLSNYASELREKLLRDGLIAKHCAQAFAVIREMSDRILGMRHFDSQIMGGWAMLQGMLAGGLAMGLVVGAGHFLEGRLGGIIFFAPEQIAGFSWQRVSRTRAPNDFFFEGSPISAIITTT